MRLILDRFEGKYGVCEGPGGQSILIPAADLPDGVREGCVLRLSAAGALSIDWEETNRRRAEMAQRQRRLFGGKTE